MCAQRLRRTWNDKSPLLRRLVAPKAHLPPTGRSDVEENEGVMLCVSWSASEEATDVRGAAQEHANRFMALPRHILTGFHPDPEGRKWFRPRNPVV